MPTLPPLSRIPAIDQTDLTSSLRINDLRFHIAEKSAFSISRHTFKLGYDTYCIITSKNHAVNTIGIIKEQNSIMNAAQVRAARGLIGMSQAELAKISGVSHPTIKRIETGGDARMSTIQALRVALEAAGVEFIAENGGGPGVRLRKD